ncbi:MAG: alpha-hydroxy-acid oxidizing enzyme [Alphaproteobacteria bacterium PA4]|nr:MAG: alpha-hydroxy-acid oxidizing enzyme [Alphaproteobacteria bacterium PA4]
MIAQRLADHRAAARRRLPRFLFDYIDGGAYAEQTLAANVSDLAAVALRQRVMVDVAHIDTSATWFGTTHALPVALGPIGLAGMYARRGEVQASRAASAASVPFCQSTLSLCSLGEVAAAGPPPWFQLYMMKDRGFMRGLIAEARDLGCPALVFTVDLPIAGARYRDRRSGLSGAPGLATDLRRYAQAALHPRWALDVGLLGRPHRLGNVAPVLGAQSGLEDFLAWIGANMDRSVSWADLEWVRDAWPGPLILKGVLDVDDARAARALGADALVVSNHGGRQLDGVLSTARALPLIADAVGDDLLLFADGGVRSGLDVLRLLALGAKGVLLGRAWAWALGGAHGGSGEAGVRHMLGIITAELQVAMALTGVTSIAEISGDVLVGGAAQAPHPLLSSRA